MRGDHEPGKTGEEAGCRILMKANGLRWFASVKEVGAMDEIIDEWDGESFFVVENASTTRMLKARTRNP